MNKVSAWGIVLPVLGAMVTVSGFIIDSYTNNSKASTIGSVSIVIGAILIAAGMWMSVWGVVLERNKKRIDKNDIKKFVRGNN